MIAGPSEITVLADSKTNLNEVTTSMIGQAEHDSNSQCILITKNSNLIKKFKKDALDYLNFQIKISLEKQKKVSNASGSLNQYKSLIRKVGRNESILQSLEDRLIILKLDLHSSCLGPPED